MDPHYTGLARDYEPWTEQEDALLGTDIDRVIATKLKRSSVAVGMRRKKLGIPSAKARRPAPAQSDS
jgi:hypothetical protein